jgi:hypothetical protein
MIPRTGGAGWYRERKELARRLAAIEEKLGL